MNAWSHLPNAVHIDRVLASLKANHEEWGATWQAALHAARDMAWHAARQAVRQAVRDTAWHAALDAAINATWDGIWDALVALIAWDDCAHLLDSEPEHVKLLAALGVESAILLYPACLVFSKEKELA